MTLQNCENCGEVFFKEWKTMTWCVTCETYESGSYEDVGEKY